MADEIKEGDICECKICHNSFPARLDEDGDIENDICCQCERDEVDQCCWERDTFD